MSSSMYSVWNYAKGAYDYYQGPPSGTTHAGTPPRARGKTQVGSTPEQAAWPLPVGAKKVGSGVNPQGRIASLGDVSSSGGIVSFIEENLAMVVAGATILYLTRKK